MSRVRYERQMNPHVSKRPFLRFRIWRRYWRDCIMYGEARARKEYKARMWAITECDDLNLSRSQDSINLDRGAGDVTAAEKH
jgi:hypothetical protein